MSYWLIDKAQIAGLGMQQTRALTAEEKDIVIQTALNTPPVRDMLDQGYTYRTEVAWMSYLAGGAFDWAYGNYADTPTGTDMGRAPVVNPGQLEFAAARIGIGTPQQYEIKVAVDLGTRNAVYAQRSPDAHVAAPDTVRPLTEEEKARLIAIARADPTARPHIGGGTIHFQWAAISPNGSGRTLNYDIIDKGIPATVPAFWTVYPAVRFRSSTWMVSVAIDLATGKVVSVFEFPLDRAAMPR